MLMSLLNHCAPTMHLKLFEDVGDVALYGIQRHVKLVGDLTVAVPTSYELQYLTLTSS
jgi:hypothetical protein